MFAFLGNGTIWHLSLHKLPKSNAINDHLIVGDQDFDETSK